MVSALEIGLTILPATIRRRILTLTIVTGLQLLEDSQDRLFLGPLDIHVEANTYDGNSRVENNQIDFDSTWSVLWKLVWLYCWLPSDGEY